MKMVRLQTLRKHIFAGIVREQGDVYSANPVHARVMVTVGHAAYLQEVAPEPVRRVEVVSAKPEREISPRTGKPKRGYNRRDQRATQ